MGEADFSGPPPAERGPQREAETPLTPRAALEKLLGGEKLGSPRAWVVVEQAELARTSARVWSLGSQGKETTSIEVAQAVADYSNAKAADRRGRFGENSEMYDAVAETFSNDVFPSYVRQARLDRPGENDGFTYTILAADKVDEDLKAIARGIPAEAAPPQSDAPAGVVADAAPDAPEPEPDTGRNWYDVKDSLGPGSFQSDREKAVQEGDYIDIARTSVRNWGFGDRASSPTEGNARVSVVGIKRDPVTKVATKLTVLVDGSLGTINPSLFTEASRPTAEETPIASSAPSAAQAEEVGAQEETGRDFLEATKGLPSYENLASKVRENDFIDMDWGYFRQLHDASTRGMLPSSGVARVRVVEIVNDALQRPYQVVLEADGYRTKRNISLFTSYRRPPAQGKH